MMDLTVPFRPAPMPFVLLLDEPVRYIRAHFRAIFPSVAVPVAVLSTLAAVVQAVAFQDAVSSEGAGQVELWTPAVLSISLLLVILAVFAYAAGQVAALDALAGRPVDMKRAWRFSLRPSVWGTLLLAGLAVVASFFACFLPVFIVAPALSFVLPVMAEEGVFGFAALSRSAALAFFSTESDLIGRLINSPIGKILVLMLVGTLISVLAGFLVALPFQLPMFVDFWRNALAGKEDAQAAMARWIWFQVPAQFLSSLVRTAIYLYTAFGIGLLFFDVRGRKEGADLRSEIEALFPAPAPPAGAPWP
jgi:hypothetical protein